MCFDPEKNGQLTGKDLDFFFDAANGRGIRGYAKMALFR
jgi:hypothetical protein